jgi:hypothetical protein
MSGTGTRLQHMFIVVVCHVPFYALWERLRIYTFITRCTLYYQEAHCNSIFTEDTCLYVNDIVYNGRLIVINKIFGNFVLLFCDTARLLCYGKVRILRV